MTASYCKCCANARGRDGKSKRILVAFVAKDEKGEPVSDMVYGLCEYCDGDALSLARRALKPSD